MSVFEYYYERLEPYVKGIGEICQVCGGAGRLKTPLNLEVFVSVTRTSGAHHWGQMRCLHLKDS
jgi:hypothetical protein